ncbi:hypothetical protein QYF36_000927 [Acer negundo]|nr:hypothetical protein QYF36_000927 [Acer negundo]
MNEEETSGQGCDRGRPHLDSGLNPIRSFAFLHRCRVVIGCCNHQNSSHNFLTSSSVQLFQISSSSSICKHLKRLVIKKIGSKSILSSNSL